MRKISIAIALISMSIVTGCQKNNGGGLTDLATPPIYTQFEADWIFPESTLNQPCMGSQEVSGTITSCREANSGIKVPDINCSKLEVKKISHRSPAGTVTNAPVLCGGLSCGLKTMTCEIGLQSGPYVLTCFAGFHEEGGTCVSNSASCSAAELGAIGAVAGIKNWSDGSYGSCLPTSCIGGRYLDVISPDVKQCKNVGFGYYSFGSSERRQCPVNSSTSTDTSISIADCTCDRHYIKNDTVCSPVNVDTPEVSSTSGLALMPLGFYYSKSSGFSITFKVKPQTQSSIKIYDNISCGGNSVPPIGSISVLDSSEYESISLYPYDEIPGTLYAKAISDAGSQSACVDILDVGADDSKPTHQLSSNPSERGFSVAFSDLGSGVLLDSMGVSISDSSVEIDSISYANPIAGMPAVNATKSASVSTVNVDVEPPLFLTKLLLAISIPSGSVTDRVGNAVNGGNYSFTMTHYGAKKLVAGDGFICVLTHGGDVRCFGSNSSSQISSPASSYVWPPVSAVLPGVKAKDLAAGANHICYIDDSAKMHCRGSNSNLQLGISGTSNTQSSNVHGVNYDSVWAGFNNTCAKRSDNGSVYCFGSNASHQLGRATGASSTNKINYANGVTYKDNGPAYPQITKIAIGEGFICALSTQSNNGEILCYGDQEYGQNGGGSAKTLVAQESDNSWGMQHRITYGAPVLGNVSDISASQYGICAIASLNGSSRNLICWGREPADTWNFNGSSNNSFVTTTEIFVNTPVRANHPVLYSSSVYLSKYSESMCLVTALTKNCWGDLNASGSGQALAMTKNTILGSDEALTGVVQTQVSEASSYAISRDTFCSLNETSGQVHCWGRFPETGCTTEKSNLCSTPFPLKR